MKLADYVETYKANLRQMAADVKGKGGKPVMKKKKKLRFQLCGYVNDPRSSLLLCLAVPIPQKAQSLIPLAHGLDMLSVLPEKQILLTLTYGSPPFTTWSKSERPPLEG